jgi:hypothetical protein
LPHLEARRIDAFKKANFEWRGLSVEAALAIPTTAFIPTRGQFEAMLDDAGLHARTIPAGTFPLAEFTPLYVATR